MNENTLVSVHGYSGDAHQIEILLPHFEHHGRPVLIVSPEDAPITKIGPHTCIFAGKRAYIGQDSWDRQYLQMKKLLEYPFEYYFMNDADSFCLTAQLPPYLFTKEPTVFSNQVDDFRKPNEFAHREPNTGPWPSDYHQGYPLIAMQPPYFMNRECLEKMVKVGKRTACATTPFIDWYMVECAADAGVAYKPFETGASCETQTANGRAVMAQRVGMYGATFIHAVKNKEAYDNIVLLHKQVLK
jgi:hypothetical protein